MANFFGEEGINSNEKNQKSLDKTFLNPNLEGFYSASHQKGINISLILSLKHARCHPLK